ncbi:Ig-like domain-containing protein [Cystobacter fuscus]|nr:Ig-like domain-containing protein [Cystobacter fuscus]
MPEHVPPDTRHTLELTWPLAAGSTDVEVTTDEDLEVGTWLLVQPGGEGPWRLTRIEGSEGWGLKLSHSLDGFPLSSRPQVSVLRPQEQATLHAAWREAAPQAGTRGVLDIKGKATPGDWAVIFVDGLEVARVQADSQGRISEAVSVQPGSTSSQVQWVTRSTSGWELGTLAPPSEPVVLEPLNNSYTNDTTPLFRGTADPGVTVFLSISGTTVGTTTADASGNWTVSVDRTLANNVYPVSVRARSGSGELSTAKVVTVVVDSDPPVTRFSSIPLPYHGSSSYSFRFTVNDYGFSECSYDGGSFQPCTSPYEVNNMTEGPHSLTVRSTDRANNVEVNPPTHQWFVDLTPPGIRITAGPPRWTNLAGAVFAFESTEEPVTFECRFDAEPPSTCVSGRNLGFYEGPHTFQVRAKDRANLYSEWSTPLEWTADFHAPAVAVLEQPSSGVLLGGTGTPTFSGTAEALGTVTILANEQEIGVAQVDAAGHWSFTPSTGLATNEYKVSVIARDQAGNASEPSVPISLRVDVDPPDTSIVSGPDGDTQEAAPRFSFSATESNVTYECSVGEEPFGSCEALTQGTRSFEPGEYTLRVRARDEAANVDDSPATRLWFYRLNEGSGGGVLGCSASGATSLLPLVSLLALLKRRRSRSSSLEGMGGWGLMASLLVLLAGSARAQGFDLQQYKPAPGSKDVLGVYSAQVAPGLGLHAGLSVGYAQNPLVLRRMSDGQFVQSIVSSQITADVFASLSFLEHFELGLALPVTSQSGPTGGDLAVFIPPNATGTGVGDLRLVPKAVLPLGALSLGVAAVVSLPTANSQSFLGAGGVGVQPMVLAQWAASERFRVLANVGGRFQPTRQLPLLGMSVGNELSYALGANWSPGGADSKLFVQGSLEGAMGLDSARSTANPLELLAAVGYSFPGNVAVRLGGGPGLSSGYGTPNFRLFAGLSWSSSESKPKKVERIDVKPATVVLAEAGQSVSLEPQAFTAKDEPVGNARFAFSSSAGQIATVDDTGKVTAVKSGSATITTKSGEVSATTPVEISIPSEIVLTGTSVSLMALGSETTLTAEVKDDAGRSVQGPKLEFASANPNVVAVEGNRLKAKGEGTTTVTVTSGPLKQTAEVTVIQVASVDVEIVPATLKVGGSAQIKVTAKGSNGAILQGVPFTYTTSDEKVATVDANGKVTVVKAGAVTLKAEGWRKSGEKKLTIKK